MLAAKGNGEGEGWKQERRGKRRLEVNVGENKLTDETERMQGRSPGGKADVCRMAGLRPGLPLGRLAKKGNVYEGQRRARATEAGGRGKRLGPVQQTCRRKNGVQRKRGARRQKDKHGGQVG